MSLENGVMLQCFEWYYPVGGKLWNDLATRARDFANKGITAMWLPPCGKGSHGGLDVGYAVYDLFDLGEFNQKGSVSTKYGARQELLKAIKAMHNAGLHVYADVVFNHKDGADETEDVMAQEVDWNDRNRPLTDWYQIKAWTKFTFPGRAGQHSTMSWFWWCFDSLSFDQNQPNASKLFRLKDKSFSTDVSHEHGNYDYLMADDLDMGEANVRTELNYWGEWFLNTTRVDGFRLDACKHIRSSWFPDWLGRLRDKFQRELFSVGEYWSANVDELQGYLAATEGVMSLFDAPLHFRFMDASRSGNQYDMRTIFDNTLTHQNPTRSVTFVENHDTQPCQSLESTVEPWFKPHAYALILLRREGYPCIFWADYFGSRYNDKNRDVTLYSHQFLIDKFLYARKAYGFGDQHDYFDHPNTIGWVRTGNGQHPGAMAVLMTNGSDGTKWMNVFHPYARFYDVTGHYGDEMVANQDGWTNFKCPAGNVSVWLQK
jgi:alpha-amylase